ncbi:L-type lectin-domain containing receptor kinase VIII.2 [Vitis vinifera]|uniref:L-type lectin-domain containing receptor kinase VIII.2 n=1 Tax=Vitis vinifera TaxID=29760 RepID=A0A438BY73_VITVI|nr:L-type lectin-domain containing receptor kinase VIII.2 [Vitis vinifera]
MASPSLSTYLTTLSLIVFFFRALSAVPILSFSLNTLGPASSSAGRFVYKRPVRVVEGNPRNSVSFSTYFSFSMSPGNGGGLAFAVFPSGFPLNVLNGSSFGLSHGLKETAIRVFAVEFDTPRDAQHGYSNGNHVGVDVANLVSVTVSNVSSIDLVLNNGERLNCWIDYEAGSKRLEVRLSKFGDIRPVSPFISHPIDLSEMWNEDEACSTLDAFTAIRSENFEEDMRPQTVHEKRACLLRVLAALIFGTGCGALGAFIALFLCTIFGNRRPVVPVPEEFVMRPVEFEYKKVNVIVDKSIQNGGK